MVRVGIWIVVCVVVFKFVLLPAQIDGASMAPTYRARGLTFVNRLAYVVHEPRRGDVVAIATSGTTIMYMKRVIGLPGETIAFHGGVAFINGRALDEPYVKGPCDWELAPETLQPNQYYFVGDNRSMPQSGHTQGRQYRDRIVGKILL
jgi:signal peptidase I